jgi:hypothetical protein
MSNEEWMPGNKAELMSAMEHEWNRLMNVVTKLEQSDQMLTPDEGGWSPKDNLSHISEWMNILMGYHMGRRPPHEVLGVSENVTKDWDLDVINAMLFERNRDRTTEDVLNELKRVYDELLIKLEGTSFEVLLMPRHADDPQKRPLLLSVLGNTTAHFEEHRITIEKML